ncbi:hypothetical protein POJ06DRAFT_257326 [Lipomyces tetrasporus]|uniref:Uncharacterized protein n=1 Tax=Lipomyces tetrasporus TaxID=54092 RepID=A0AAD7VRC3_9ASCO|nr:uncharacterized protein POJ06DRAFT_257326 [Lipomyces tetrasporus]KAJ8098544.1 hypothetical protein POJ06DRAFT_257326 [Lipomyces tetrasporus]
MNPMHGSILREFISPFLLKVRRSFYPFPSLLSLSILLFPSRSHSIFLDGTKLAFTSQMTERYLRSYPEIRNPMSMFSQSRIRPHVGQPHQYGPGGGSPRQQGEYFSSPTFSISTAIVIIVQESNCRTMNHLMSNDVLILNMPLPCSQAAWLARDEEDWSLAMKRHPPPTNHLSSGFNSRGRDALSSEIFLKTILSKFTKEDLLVEIGTGVGFVDSDEPRRLIILCASEQFA